MPWSLQAIQLGGEVTLKPLDATLTMPSNGTSPILIWFGFCRSSCISVSTRAFAADFTDTIRLVLGGLCQSFVQLELSEARQFIDPVLSITSASSSRLEECTTSASTLTCIELSGSDFPSREVSGRKIVFIVASAST